MLPAESTEATSGLPLEYVTFTSVRTAPALSTIRSRAWIVFPSFTVNSRIVVLDDGSTKEMFAMLVTTNGTDPLVPAPVTILTSRLPNDAPASMTNVAAKVVGLVTLTELTVTPVALSVTVVAPRTKLLPASVTLTLVPGTPLLLVTEVKVGARSAAVKATVAVDADAVKVWLSPVPR